MSLKDIVVLLDQVRETSPATEMAIDLARRANAHLNGVALAIDPIVPGFIVAPIPVDAFEVARVESLKVAQEALDRFETAARKEAISAEPRLAEVLVGGAPEVFTAHCRLTDLIVIGQSDPDRPEPMREALIEAALFEGSAPLLLVPYINHGGFAARKVMIAWDGGRAAARAVHAALPLLPLAAEITVVIVGTPPRDGEPGADVATYLARHGLKVTVETLPAAPSGVADTLLNHVADRNYDLVVMGGYGHSRFREMILGGATRDMLKTMTVPVMMAH
jgi:nucleotide-binding universal stress UspA family protein